MSTGDPLVSECAEQLVAALAQLYGEGLKRTVDAVAASAGGEQVVRRLAGDELVGNLLLLHGLHPDDLDTRIQQALDRVRPYLGSHAGGIEYLGVTDSGVAMLRLEGSCDGCAGSAATVHTAVERAVLEAAPEVEQRRSRRDGRDEADPTAADRDALPGRAGRRGGYMTELARSSSGRALLRRPTRGA